METLRLADILRPIRGVIVRGNKNRMVSHVATQTRDIKKNTLYFDFHNTNITRSIPPLYQSVVCITERPFTMLNHVNRYVTIVKVKSVRDAYWSFIRFYRNLFQIPVIGITGTCGKTTTTEMMKKVLSQRYQHVQGTYDGKNNLSNNLPYLLDFNRNTEAAVIEMGVSHPGCIQNSCRYFQPQIGIILNIGVYHLLGCKTLDNYIKAKAEMVHGIAPGGTLILHAEDENINKIDLSQFKGKIVYFGVSERAHYQAINIQYANKGMSFTLHHNQQTYPLFVPGYGQHNVLNALAAIAAAHTLGIPIEQAAKGLASFQPVRQHLEFRTGLNNCTIIDDTWNCTPPSIDSALQVLKESSRHKKSIAVLGYMPQLGENATNEYDKVAKKVLDAGVDQLILIGEAKRIGKKAIALGMNRHRIFYCQTAKEVYDALVPGLDKHSIVLFKFPYKFRLSKFPSFRKLMSKMIKEA